MIWLSNEEDTPVEVYFDDFKVTQIKSPVVQMDDYYPFGQTFNSYQRENSVVNKFQFNGKEKQDALDINWIDFGARMYMPEIGRWGVVDPLGELSRKWSPYNYAFDNPIRFIDTDGMYSTEEWKKDNGVTDNDLINIYTAPSENTKNDDDPREGNEVQNIDLSKARVVRIHGESSFRGLINTTDNTLYKKARDLRIDVSGIGPSLPTKVLEALNQIEGIINLDQEAQGVSAAWMDAAKASNGYDYIDRTSDGGIIYREVRNANKHFGVDSGYGNLVTMKMVWDKDGNFLYGVQYKGAIVQSENGGKDFYVIPIVSSPGSIEERKKPILLKPNIE